MIKNLNVSIPPSAAAELIASAITQPKTIALVFGTKGGRLLDDYRVETTCGTYICQVYTRYYARMGSFVTLVVTITDVSGVTIVHMATGGHKRLDSGLNENDLGASASFFSIVEKSLADHVMPVPME